MLERKSTGDGLLKLLSVLIRARCREGAPGHTTLMKRDAPLVPASQKSFTTLEGSHREKILRGITVTTSEMSLFKESSKDPENQGIKMAHCTGVVLLIFHY
ncbi:hypothetical protein KOW79_008611 [Hemibagrus wyckioides]|uniref:Uncharacterized protein n=1 Tax=Hemibagrus wyckioides TaxID=337641 RepID=A0A9D3NXF1_9TELE|nr:hypothetical protein KOW79_008611 [Hemibagrus wyckioides]